MPTGFTAPELIESLFLVNPAGMLQDGEVFWLIRLVCCRVRGFLVNPAGMLQGGEVFWLIRLVCCRVERLLGESGWYVAGWRGF